MLVDKKEWGKKKLAGAPFYIKTMVLNCGPQFEVAATMMEPHFLWHQPHFPAI